MTKRVLGFQAALGVPVETSSNEVNEVLLVTPQDLGQSL